MEICGIFIRGRKDVEKTSVLTFDHVYHDIRRFRVARGTSVISTMWKFHFVDDQDRSVFRSFHSDTRLVVVVDHAPLSIPEDEAGRLGRRD